jgi:hypothetical protein
MNIDKRITKIENKLNSDGRSKYYDEKRRFGLLALIKEYHAAGGQVEFTGELRTYDDFRRWFKQVWWRWESKLVRGFGLRSAGAEAEITVIEAVMPTIGRDLRAAQESDYQSGNE